MPAWNQSGTSSSSSPFRNVGKVNFDGKTGHGTKRQNIIPRSCRPVKSEIRSRRNTLQVVRTMDIHVRRMAMKHCRYEGAGDCTAFGTATLPGQDLGHECPSYRGQGFSMIVPHAAGAFLGH